MKKDNDVEVVVIDEAEIPNIVTSQFSSLQELSNKYEDALTKAKSAKEAAETAHEKSAGLFKKKEAIEALQDAQLDTAEALISMTDVQKLTLEYQEKITQITQYLFGLGVSNIAANRSVVRQLELKLKGASKEELSELARQELLNVVKQLKAQEDKDVEHDRKLAEQVAKDEEHDRLLEEGKKRDLEQDKIIGTLRDQINELENKLESVEQDKFNKKWGYISLFVGIVGLILSVIQFVL